MDDRGPWLEERCSGLCRSLRSAAEWPGSARLRARRGPPSSRRSRSSSSSSSRRRPSAMGEAPPRSPGTAGELRAADGPRQRARRGRRAPPAARSWGAGWAELPAFWARTGGLQLLVVRGGRFCVNSRTLWSWSDRAKGVLWTCHLTTSETRSQARI